VTEVRLIQVPYHLGREQVVLGAGPAPLAQAIGGDTIVVERPGPFDNEVSASFDVMRALAASVRETVQAGGFPLVLAGNCSSALGTIAGLDREVGVVWFDAHADFHVPDSTPTGFFDGFSLALVTGEGWTELRETVEGAHAVPQDRVVLAGTRDLDPTEKPRLARSAIARADAHSLEDSLAELAERVDAVYVHVDLDVLDPVEGRANGWSVEGGFSAAELGRAVDSIAARFEIPAAALTAYDPSVDLEGRVPPIAAALARRLVRQEVAS
jgi:arginase